MPIIVCTVYKKLLSKITDSKVEDCWYWSLCVYRYDLESAASTLPSYTLVL